MYQSTVEKQVVIDHLFHDDGRFPNNSKLPLLVYPKYFDIAGGEEGRKTIEETFAANLWNPAWYEGIYDYHHYHSTAHEVLGVSQGDAKLLFGGPSGQIIDVQAGDVIIIPAGVAHKCVICSEDFKCVGAYPEGQHYDLLTGEPEEKETALKNIAQVPLPAKDPAFGGSVPLFDFWPTT